MVQYGRTTGYNTGTAYGRMLFNSLQFVAFFIAVYGLYLFLSHRRQNAMLVLAGCVFYGAWDWRFLFLLFFSVSVDYVAARRIHGSDDPKVRKRWLWLSIGTNLVILGFFKYFNFFDANLARLLGTFGLAVHPIALKLVLPLGISFYTFEAISYVTDVYRKVAAPAKGYWSYVLFILFFPHLIAGPIMRANDFLPQIETPRRITRERIANGIYLIVWGLFLKVVVADNLAAIVDPFFASAAPYAASRVIIIAYAFTFQIYGDFAGYSNMARGLASLLGFELPTNFLAPLASSNPSEFWRRWHITLSSWLRDYVYIPLGGSRRGTMRTYVNLFVTMLLGGLWHGANWTFVVWGAYNGLLLVAYRLLEPLRRLFRPRSAFERGVARTVAVLAYFQLTALGFLLFRSKTLTQFWLMMKGLASGATSLPYLRYEGVTLAIFAVAVIVMEWFQRRTDDPSAARRWPLIARFWAYMAVAYAIVMLGNFGVREFIYFQF